ncbi:UNVERIFIED_CONTAM: hypothetical protein FKN15_016300 [Acipenser sinensis]
MLPRRKKLLLLSPGKTQSLQQQSPGIMWMRRDRLVVTLILATGFIADLYFNIFPKVQEKYFKNDCTCQDFKATGESNSSSRDYWQNPSTDTSLPITSEAGTQTQTGAIGSQLQRLFSHPLYNIQTPDLRPEEYLLQREETLNYYIRKVSRWNRHQRYYNTAANISATAQVVSFEPESSWVKFHMGINRYSLYSRDDPNIDQLLKDMGKIDIINADYTQDEKILKGICDCTQANNVCFFAKCLYMCKTEYAVCGNPDMLEGSLSAYVPGLTLAPRFSIPNPWIRSYTFANKEEWEVNPHYCDTIKQLYPYNSGNRLLNIIDMAIFDFLIGNMDRHHYEIFTKFGDDGFLLHFDNARGVFCVWGEKTGRNGQRKLCGEVRYLPRVQNPPWQGEEEDCPGREDEEAEHPQPKAPLAGEEYLLVSPPPIAGSASASSKADWSILLRGDLGLAGGA